MSLTYRTTTRNTDRKVRPSVKLRNELSDVYQQKVSEYDLLRSELTSSEDADECKFERLSELRDEVNRLAAQLEVLNLL